MGRYPLTMLTCGGCGWAFGYAIDHSEWAVAVLALAITSLWMRVAFYADAYK
jgi:hypothetical protein